MELLLLFLEFFKIGLFTFGGGYAMIPLIEEAVLKHGWLTQAEFTNFIGVCESTPGPIAVNMATYVGSTQFGILGSLVASFGVILPSFLIILLVASILKNFTSNKYFKSFLNGVKPVVLALILTTGITLFIQIIGYNFHSAEFNFQLESLLVFLEISALYLIFRYIIKIKLNSIILIVLSAILGIVMCVII